MERNSNNAITLSTVLEVFLVVGVYCSLGSEKGLKNAVKREITVDLLGEGGRGYVLSLAVQLVQLHRTVSLFIVYFVPR
jgi:hypothetical protein